MSRGRRRSLWLVSVVVLLATALLLWQASRQQQLQLVFLDVGQGDATVIITPDGKIALIDGSRSTTRLLEHLEALGIDHFDLVVATHADFDHIAGLVRVMEDYPVANFIDNGVPHTTQAYQNLLAAVAASGARYLEASDRVLTLGDVILTVLPPPLGSDDQNGNSVGLLLSYGGFEAILPGDATAEEQGWWQDHYRDLLDDVDVYKAAHHGSSTGDRSGFVRLLDPEVVAVSAGLDNSYGHPHREAVETATAVSGRASTGPIATLRLRSWCRPEVRQATASPPGRCSPLARAACWGFWRRCSPSWRHS